MITNKAKLDLLQQSLEQAMLKTFENLGDQTQELSFFATVEEEALTAPEK